MAKSSGKSPPPANKAATATMLAFANPSMAESAQQVAEDCAREGFATIGISIDGAQTVIDFGRFDSQSCIDLANSIELCVDGKGFQVPSLAATFDVMREQGTQITFDNFVKALTKIMTPKS